MLKQRNKANTKYDLKLAELLDSESKEKAAKKIEEKEEELFKLHEVIVIFIKMFCIRFNCYSKLSYNKTNKILEKNCMYLV